MYKFNRKMKKKKVRQPDVTPLTLVKRHQIDTVDLDIILDISRIMETKGAYCCTFSRSFRHRKWRIFMKIFY